MTYRDWPGFKNESRLFVDYQAVYEILARFEAPLREKNLAGVVGILRGGAVPAVMLGQRLGLPVGFLHYDRANPAPQISASFPLAGSTILVVDDFSSTGSTLKAAIDHMRAAGATPVTCTIYYDTKRAALKPDVGLPAEQFIVFPWERKDLSPGSQAIIRQKDGRVAPADEKELVGIDLDGVLVSDIRRKWYARHALETLLHLRDSYELKTDLPPWRPHEAVVITGRPDTDFERTRAWLDKNSLQELGLVCRNPEKHGTTLADMASHKAHYIARLGITRFYESDLQQALVIAEACPFTEVIWWGKSKRLRLTASRVGSGFPLSGPSAHP